MPLLSDQQDTPAVAECPSESLSFRVSSASASPDTSASLFEGLRLGGTEPDLRAAVEYATLIFNAAPIGAVVYRANGRCLAANAEAGRILAATPAQLKEEDFRRLASWRQSTLLASAERCLDEDRTIDDVFYLTERKYGLPIWAACRLIPFDYRGERHFLLLFSDVTEKKKIEEQNRIHLEKLETALDQTVTVFRTLGELRDPYTAGHERRVGELAAAIGAQLGFNVYEQRGLRIAGSLHDIGKIGLPAETLAKPGALSAAEFELIKEHSAAGYKILKNVDFPWPVALVALQHHERMDGSGYPQRLTGDDISREARIVAVADVVEAMHSHRPYRPARGISEALAEIELGRGVTFDADAADACLRLFRRNGYLLPD